MDASAVLVPGAVADGAWGLPSVFLTANQSRVLLSVPEGTTRRALDAKLSLPVPTLQPVRPGLPLAAASALVLLPAATSAAAGGLQGTLMSIADGARAKVEQLPPKMLRDKHVPPLRLIGPENTRHLVALARAFSRRDGFGLDVHQVDAAHDVNTPVHQDVSLSVYALAVNLSAQREERSPKRRRPTPPPESTSEYLTHVIAAMFDASGKPSGRTEDVDPAQLGNRGTYLSRPLPDPLRPHLIPAKEHSSLGPESLNAASIPRQVVVYAIETAPTLPKIDLARAEAHGCTPGAHMRELRDGKSITIQRPKGWIVPDLAAGETLPTWEEDTALPAEGRERQLMLQSRWVTMMSRNPPGKQGKTLSGLKKAEAALLKEQTKDAPPGGDGRQAQRVAELQIKVDHAREAYARYEEVVNVPLEEATLSAEQTTSAPLPGGAFVQIYLPHEAFVEPFLVQAPKLFKRYENNERAQLRSVLHIVHPRVWEDKRYQAFVQSLPRDVAQILSSAPYVKDALSYPRAALGLHKVSHLDGDMFSVPPYSLTAQKQAKGATPLDESLNLRLMPPPKGSGLTPLVDPESGSGERSAMQPYLQAPLRFPLDENFARNADAEVARSFEREMLASGQAKGGAKSKRQLRAEGKVEAWNEYVQLAERIREEVASLPPPPHKKEWEEVLLTPLGTGSASPSPDRNVSSTLIEYDHRPSRGETKEHYGAILLDCGESTLGQLCRRLGAERTSEVLRDLRVLYISHKHADHLLGVFRLLAARAALNPSTPLFLVTSDEIYGAIREWDAMESLGLWSAQGGVSYIPAQMIRASVPSGDILTPPPGCGGKAYSPKNQDVQAFAGWWFTHTKFSQPEEVEQRLSQLGKYGLTLQTVPVNHRCVHAYGVVITHASGSDGGKWGLTYSGDTIPSSALASISRSCGVDVFLHEATMGDDMADDAFGKRHSTMSQALGVVAASQAPLAVLTHFSQRYPKLPKLGDVQQGLTVTLSFDLMRLKLSEAWKFPLFLPALEMLYRADDEMSAQTQNQNQTQTQTQNQEESRTGKQREVTDWTYLLWELSPVQATAQTCVGPIPDLVEAALVSLYGQAGGVLRVAVVHTEEQEGKCRAVLRAAKGDEEKLSAALAALKVDGYRPQVVTRAPTPRALWALVGAGAEREREPAWVEEELKRLEDM